MADKILKTLMLLLFPLLLGASCSFVPQRKIADGGVWLSTDKAQSWTQKIFISQGKETDDPADDELLDKANIKYLRFHPLDSRIIYAVTTSDVFFSENGGDQWQPVMREASPGDLAPDPLLRGTLYAALGNTVMKTVDNGSNWTQTYVDSRPGVFASQLAIDPLNPSKIYLGTNHGDLLVSEDAGSSWQAVEGFIAAKEDLRLRNLSIVEILLNPRDTQQIYLGTPSQGILASFDGGQSWQNLSENFREYHNANQFRSLHLDETRDGAMLYASSYGLLWSLDGGLSWTPLELLTPPNTVNIRTISINPNNPNEIYYVSERVLYKTLDGGLNWIAQTLPGSRLATSLLIDFFDSSRLYLGVEAPQKQGKGLIRF